MSTYTLQNEITGYIVINDMVCSATIVGIDGDKLAVIARDEISTSTHKVKEVFPNRLHAEATLKDLLSDRVLLGKFDQRHAVA